MISVHWEVKSLPLVHSASLGFYSAAVLLFHQPGFFMMLAGMGKNLREICEQRSCQAAMQIDTLPPQLLC